MPRTMTESEVNFIRAISFSHDMPVNESIHFMMGLMMARLCDEAAVVQGELELGECYNTDCLNIYVDYITPEDAIKGFEQAMG